VNHEAKGTVLLTGGGGYLGSVLVRDLLDSDYRVRVLDRFFFGLEPLKPVLNHPSLQVEKGDIRYIDPGLLSGVDTVIDLAGLSNDPSSELNPQATRRIHAGAAHVADLAKKHGVKRYVYSSSCSVYGQGQSESLDETSPLNPVSLYAKTKSQAEKQLLALADDSFAVTLLRNGTVFGLSPRMRFDLVVNLMTLTAWKKRRIHVLGGGKQWRPLIHVKDTARAFMLVMESPADLVAGQIFNVGSDEQNYQIIQIASMVAKVIDGVEVEVVPDDPDKRTYNVSFSKIAETLNFRPRVTIPEAVEEIYRALEEGVVDGDDIRTRTVEYYKFLVHADQVLRDIKLKNRIF
jgi:nucleoside-diphosphate-sugar epimerase